MRKECCNCQLCVKLSQDTCTALYYTASLKTYFSEFNLLCVLCIYYCVCLPPLKRSFVFLLHFSEFNLCVCMYLLLRLPPPLKRSFVDLSSCLTSDAHILPFTLGHILISIKMFPTFSDVVLTLRNIPISKKVSEISNFTYL